MLVQLSQKPTPPRDPNEAIDLLVDCHARIRRFTEIAQRLATVPHAPDAQVVDAAASLRRYFEQAFPLHVIDEDISLLPRLKQLRLPSEVAVAIQVLELEHSEIEPLVEGMCLLWKDVERSPARLAELQPQMLEILDSLRPKLLTHLELEEAVVLPYARATLGAQALSEVAQQMRHRRSA